MPKNKISPVYLAKVALNFLFSSPHFSSVTATWDVFRQGNGQVFTFIYESYFEIRFAYIFSTVTDPNLVKDTLLDLFVELRKRWLDLLRLGRDFTKKTIMDVHGKDIAEKHFLWPIPTSEIDLNDAIDESEQNPGY